MSWHKYVPPPLPLRRIKMLLIPATDRAKLLFGSHHISNIPPFTTLASDEVVLWEDYGKLGLVIANDSFKPIQVNEPYGFGFGDFLHAEIEEGPGD